MLLFVLNQLTEQDSPEWEAATPPFKVAREEIMQLPSLALSLFGELLPRTGTALTELS